MDADERTEQGQDLIVLALNTRVSAAIIEMWWQATMVSLYGLGHSNALAN